MKRALRFTRRDFLKLMGIAALDVFLLVVGGAGYGYLMDPFGLRWKRSG